MIDRVYYIVTGRNAKADEYAYWVPRKEHFQLIVKAGRSWLWSNKDELEAAAGRAWKFRDKKDPTSADVAFTVKKFAFVSDANGASAQDELTAEIGTGCP